MLYLLFLLIIFLIGCVGFVTYNTKLLKNSHHLHMGQLQNVKSSLIKEVHLKNEKIVISSIFKRQYDDAFKILKDEIIEYQNVVLNRLTNQNNN